MRRHVMKAAGIADQVVTGRLQSNLEDARLPEGNGRPRFLRQLAKPFHRRLGVVDGFHGEAAPSEENGVPAIAASYVDGSARPNEPFVNALREALVWVTHEERTWLGAVCVEAVPPSASARVQERIQLASLGFSQVGKVRGHDRCLARPT